jgi:hypothetical protein
MRRLDEAIEAAEPFRCPFDGGRLLVFDCSHFAISMAENMSASLSAVPVRRYAVTVATVTGCCHTPVVIEIWLGHFDQSYCTGCFRPFVPMGPMQWLALGPEWKWGPGLLEVIPADTAPRGPRSLWLLLRRWAAEFAIRFS